MIKNKYYIGQMVGVVKENLVGSIESIHTDDVTIVYTVSFVAYRSDFIEDELEPMPEKQKIVLWQYIIATGVGNEERWATDGVYYDKLKTGATKEVEP